MLKITLIAVGKLKEPYWRAAQAEYLKRLGPYATVDIVEIGDVPDSLGLETVLKREGDAILKAVPAGAITVLLDIESPGYPSEKNAAILQQHLIDGHVHLAYIIGGSNGVSPEVFVTVDERLSLGPITLPHNLARIVLLEQIYRSFKIMRGEPYHK
jgi:23S rRNA (pseudouridine1915-N3)-methyltransferase